MMTGRHVTTNSLLPIILPIDDNSRTNLCCLIQLRTHTENGEDDSYTVGCKHYG
ncbi:hypothetical protein KP509_36G011500 [Ceratopteris richardii]|uniref:Uncharacterized protein n=1 Tax=Ceratopteris richardii TaxID=49495 RepID=A0A8T2QAN5_CERRI|nr:hypothetical protein KP509_36G011500 [Ceratopteris richardii]